LAQRQIGRPRLISLWLVTAPPTAPTAPPTNAPVSGAAAGHRTYSGTGAGPQQSARDGAVASAVTTTSQRESEAGPDNCRRESRSDHIVILRQTVCYHSWLSGDRNGTSTGSETTQPMPISQRAATACLQFVCTFAPSTRSSSPLPSTPAPLACSECPSNPAPCGCRTDRRPR
jgi:hypothetical protein